MGTWGAGSFENDTALDFIGELKSADAVSQVFSQMSETAEADADGAAHAIACAELIAIAMGRPGADAPDVAIAFAESHRDALLDLRSQAVRAVTTVSQNSELADLWAEDGDDGEWREQVALLLRRLDPDHPYEPPARPDAPPGEIGFVCALCGQGGTAAEEVILRFETDISSSTLYAHRACIEERFDQPHFDAAGEPHPDLVGRIQRALGIAD